MRQTKLFLILFLVIVSAVIIEIIIISLENYKHVRASVPISNTSAKFQGFTISSQTQNLGATFVSSDGNSLQVIATLTKVFKDTKGNIYITLDLSNTYANKQIIVSNGQIPLSLTKQNTSDFYANSKNTKAFVLQPNNIMTTLSAYEGHQIIAVLISALPPLPTAIEEKIQSSPTEQFFTQYFPCNQLLMSNLQGSSSAASSCTPYVSQIKVYDANF